MPLVRITPDLEMSYRDDTFADAWRTPEPVLLLHGNAESGEAWNAWLPVLGRRFRVVRPDMRGFGRSTPMPLDYRWSIDRIIEDFIALTDVLGLQAFHIGAAKIADRHSRYLTYHRPGEDVIADISKTSWDAYVAVGGKGYGRVDLRLDAATGKLYVLEVNAQCGISEDEDFTSIGAILRLSGKSFSQMVQEIINNAFARKRRRKRTIAAPKKAPVTRKKVLAKRRA